MDNLQINPQFIKNGLKTFNNKEIKVHINQPEYNNGNEAYDSVFLNTIETIRDIKYNKNNTLVLDDKEFISGNNDFYYGGAGDKKKNDKKKQVNRQPIQLKKTVFDVKYIGNEILNDIISRKMFFSVNEMSELRLSDFISEYIKQQELHINHLEYETIIRYLKDHLFKAVKEKIMQKHSLASISDYSLVINPLMSIQMNHISCKEMDYKQKIAITKAVSNKWENLSSLYNFSSRVSMNKNVIHPLFFILFANKFPGIEDLIIQQDYGCMVDQIRSNTLQQENAFLLFLRMTDMALLPSIDKEEQTSVGNESLRISISMLLRELAYSIRKGTFENEASCHLEHILSKIMMPGAKFKEECMLQAILATFSYRPTVITKATVNNMPVANLLGFTNSQSPLIYETPKAVYNIEYPISDFYSFSENEILKFSDSNFNFLGFDFKTNKAIFTYSNNMETVYEDKDNLLNNLYNLLQNSSQQPKLLEASYNTIIPNVFAHNPQLETIYQNITPIKIMLTTGLYISVPREQKRFYCGPENNIFFKSLHSPTINISHIDFETTMVINKITYFLTAALCYDILDSEDGSFGDVISMRGIASVNASQKLGTLAIVRADNNWIEYNPQDTITSDRIKFKVQKALYNEYMKIAPKDREDYDEWKEKNQSSIEKEIIKGHVSISDMIIREEDALKKIGSQACLLFYSEDYPTYQSRMLNKWFM